MKSTQVIKNFNDAAKSYDSAADVQSAVAHKLVIWASGKIANPTTLLDIGCGTGLVGEELLRHWPSAELTGVDASPAMLQEAKRKIPNLQTVTSDASTIHFDKKFDAIFSSMLLHWLPDPQKTIRDWQKYLNPEGHLFVAVPVDGSFHEWYNLCKQFSVEDGLWLLPHPDFANDRAECTQHIELPITHDSATDFLKSMQRTGAATPRPKHKPASTGKLRRLLTSSPRPFSISYRLVFLEFPASADPSQ